VISAFRLRLPSILADCTTRETEIAEMWREGGEGARVSTPAACTPMARPPRTARKGRYCRAVCTPEGSLSWKVAGHEPMPLRACRSLTRRLLFLPRPLCSAPWPAALPGAPCRRDVQDQGESPQVNGSHSTPGTARTGTCVLFRGAPLPYWSRDHREPCLPRWHPASRPTGPPAARPAARLP
jgi:hypothetical protein